MKKINIADIKAKQKRLKYASKELKKHFVGIDHIIDHVIKDIETWYVMPELLTRPVIICLWGLTGTGKTDLVRRLVKLLEFNDRYCEIELVNKGSSHYPWATSISGILSQNQLIESGQSSVILLDEIQGFRTVDEGGNELFDYRFRDVWTLLSDGKLPFKVDMEYITEMLWDYKVHDEKAKSPISIDDDDDENDELAKKIRKTMGVPVSSIDDFDEDDEGPGPGKWHYYSLKRFKTTLRLEESIDEISAWSDAKKREIVMAKLNDPSMYEEEDYTKTLIFVSGNLDEAYSFAKETDEVDLDADIFNELSKKLTVLDIKAALTQRFKPEQIARFGNDHVLYPSLNRASYSTIIDRKIKEISRNVKSKFGITLVVKQPLKDLIYSNGVFPTQGTRPLFSTISEILESLLPKFLLGAVMKSESKMVLDYENKNIVARIGDRIMKRPYIGTLDKIKNKKNLNKDRRALTAVHEAGHALTYALLFNASPPQMVTTPSSHKAEGFIFVHDNCGAKELIENKIAVSMAGAAAERMIFGDRGATWGGKSDLRKATEYAARMVRNASMGSFDSYIQPESDNGSAILNTNDSATNEEINQIVADGYDKALKLLEDNKALLTDIIDTFMSQDSVAPPEFRKVCEKHGKKIKCPLSNESFHLNYNTQYKRFKEKDNG